MIAAKEKSQEIIEKLHTRLTEERYFTSAEFFTYSGEMRGVGKASSKDNMAWAYFHVCNQDKDKALYFFRKSLNYKTADISFARNYLVFLFKNGMAKELIQAIQKSNTKESFLGSQHFMFERLFTSILRGDLQEAMRVSDSLINLKNNLSELYEAMKKKIHLFSSFSDLKEAELKKLGEIYTNLIEENQLYAVGRFDFRTYPDVDVNHISLIVSDKHRDIIGKLNFDLAYALASNDCFDDKNFSASVDMSIQNETINATTL